MLEIRPLVISEDRVLPSEVFRIRAEPGVDILGLDRNDASVVAGGGDFGRRVICDCSERQKVGFARSLPEWP